MFTLWNLYGRASRVSLPLMHPPTLIYFFFFLMIHLRHVSSIMSSSTESSCMLSIYFNQNEYFQSNYTILPKDNVSTISLLKFYLSSNKKIDGIFSWPTIFRYYYYYLISIIDTTGEKCDHLQETKDLKLFCKDNSECIILLLWPLWKNYVWTSLCWIVERGNYLMDNDRDW